MGIGMERLELYAYSTKSDLANGKVKVGHAKVGRWEERIREQFGTSNSEPPIMKWIGFLPEGTRDSDVHNILLGMKCTKPDNSPGKEWFYVPENKNPFDIVQTAFHVLVYGSPRSKKYILRREQEEAVLKAHKWFNGDHSEEVLRSVTHPNRFLINAKMRYGKCFTSIHLAKKVKSKKTLIVTYKPDVIGEWIETVNDQVDFEGWTGYRAKFKPETPADPYLKNDGSFSKKHQNEIVVCVSLQDLYIDGDGNTKERLKMIPETTWDLVIFDEVHYGSRTDRALEILERLKFKRRLDLSGTPFRLIEQDDFASQQVYTYSYLDEMANKAEEIKNDPSCKKEKVYRQMPNLNISAIEITDEDINEQVLNFRTDDIDFSLNRLFETNDDGQFIYEDAVDHFIDGLIREDHQARSISVYGKLGLRLGCPPKRHTVWWLRRVASISALIRKLENHPHFSDFILINASGNDEKKDENDSVYALEKSKVQNAIKEANSSGKRGTITFTCGRFLTGVTIKEWDSILILNDTTSAESYYQAIFRVQSAWVSEELEVLKPEAWVFDFAINRCLKVTYDCANAISDQVSQQESADGKLDVNKDNLGIITQGLCDDLRITKRFFEGDLVESPVTAKEIFEALNHEGAKVALARRITSGALVDFGKLKLLEHRKDIFEILKKVKGYRTLNVADLSSKTLVEIGGENGDPIGGTGTPKPPKKVKTDKDKEEEKRKNKHRDWYATQIKRLAICMADFIYMTYQIEGHIDDVIQTKSPEFFEIMTGISKDDFVLLCDLGFMNRSALNRIVREFRDQEVTSLRPEEYILENLLKMAA